MSAIAAYVRALSDRLPGPAATRADLLAEARDSLDDAAAAFARAGMRAAQAELAAVARFGDVDRVAADYRREIAAAQGRRTAALLMVSMPALLLAWDAVVVWSARRSTAAPTAVQGLLAQAIDAASLTCAGGAAVALLVLSLGARRDWPTAAVTRLLAAGGIATIATIGVCAVWMNAFDDMPVGGAAPIVLCVISVVVALVQLRSLARSVGASGSRCGAARAARSPVP